MSATVRDIARLAGVSTATVSRALRDFPSVDPLIRERVLQAAGRLDYVGSPAAAALSTGRTNTIAIITPYIARWSFTRMLAGVDRALRTTPMDLLVYCLGDPSDPHPAPPHRRLRNRVDAFLVLSVSKVAVSQMSSILPSFVTRLSSNDFIISPCTSLWTKSFANSRSDFATKSIVLIPSASASE